jgi:hypothetical protein
MDIRDSRNIAPILDCLFQICVVLARATRSQWQCLLLCAGSPRCPWRRHQLLDFCLQRALHEDESELEPKLINTLEASSRKLKNYAFSRMTPEN